MASFNVENRPGETPGFGETIIVAGVLPLATLLGVILLDGVAPGQVNRGVVSNAGGSPSSTAIAKEIAAIATADAQVRAKVKAFDEMWEGPDGRNLLAGKVTHRIEDPFCPKMEVEPGTPILSHPLKEAAVLGQAAGGILACRRVELTDGAGNTATFIVNDLGFVPIPNSR